VAAVEHRRDGIVVGHGVKSSFWFLEISENGMLALTPPVGAEGEDLGELILHVARSKSGNRPRAAADVSVATTGAAGAPSV
jgi:hypothetical protein